MVEIDISFGVVVLKICSVPFLSFYAYSFQEISAVFISHTMGQCIFIYFSSSLEAMEEF